MDLEGMVYVESRTDDAVDLFGFISWLYIDKDMEYDSYLDLPRTEQRTLKKEFDKFMHR